MSTGSMEQMFLLVYNELHQLAARKLRSERDGHTLSTTALVNEAWLELNKLNRIQWQNRAHFLAVAAQAMRRILIDYAVARRREKRGGGQVLVSLDDGDALAIAQMSSSSSTRRSPACRKSASVRRAPSNAGSTAA
jgi:RNA polymerase sigma factor (TIGR02999 family)